MGLSRTLWVIARLTISSANVELSEARATFSRLNFVQDGKTVAIGSHEAIAVEPAERLALVYNALEAAMFVCAEDQGALLEWTFSPVCLAPEAVGDALAEWRSTGEPPLFSLLTLEKRELGAALDQAVATVGLGAFTGYEVAFVESPTLGRQQAARLVTWLARSALAGIALRPGRFLGPDGIGACELSATSGVDGAVLLEARMVKSETKSD